MRPRLKRSTLIALLPLLLVAGFFVWMGATTMQNGKTLMFGHPWYIGGLILLVSVVSFRLGRDGWRAFSPLKLVLILGIALWDCARLMEPGAPLKAWLEGGGSALMLLSVLAQIAGTQGRKTDASKITAP